MNRFLMKCIVIIVGIAILTPVAVTANTKAPDARIAWWRQATFGMLITWGVYSVPGRGEWLMYQEHIPFEEYAKLANRFNPQHYNPQEWVKIAKETGMKYIVLTTRHHDGFCLFDSKVSDFTAPKTAAGRDLIAEFADACHDAGMRMGFYYSLVDWRFPGVLPRHSVVKDASVYKPAVEQAHAQIRELLTNYGKVDILWYDGMFPPNTEIWRSKQLNEMVRKLQPDIIINNRSGLPGDFATPENVITPHPRPWESCYPMNRTWGYAPYDRNYKPVAEILRLLTSCASQGGNFLLSVGPDADGTLPPEAVERLRKIGKWMEVNGKAIYGAGPSPVVAPGLGLESRVGDNVYLLIQRWPGPTVPFAWCGSKVKSASLLVTGQQARIEQKGDRVWLRDLPQYPPELYLNVIELTFEGEPRASYPPYR